MADVPDDDVITDDYLQQTTHGFKATPAADPSKGPAGGASWWQRNITGTGMSDPNIPEQRPWAPEGTGLGDKLAVATAPFYTSDPDEVANLYVKHYGAKKRTDEYGSTIVTMPDGYEFDPNKKGISQADIKSFIAHGVPDFLISKLFKPGAVVQGAVQAGTQLARSGIGGVAGTGITPIKAAVDSIFAGGLTAGGVAAAPSIGRGLSRIGEATGISSVLSGAGTLLNKALGRVDPSAAANEGLIASLMSKQGYDWEGIPLAARREIIGEVGSMNPTQIAAALNDPKKAQQLFTAATGKEFKVDLSRGQAAGDVEQLAKEAQLAQRLPGSQLAQSYEAQTQQLGGLINKELVPPEQAGKAAQQAMQQLPGSARQAETAAWGDVGTNYGNKRLFSSSAGRLDETVAKALEGKAPSRGTAPAASEIQARIDALTANPRSGIRVSDVVALRNDIATKIANLPQTNPAKAATEIKYLEKMREGIDSYLTNNSSPELTAATNAAIEASTKANRLAKPQAPAHDEVGSVIDSLMHDTEQTPLQAYRRTVDSHKSDAILQNMRDSLPGGENHEVFDLLRGGMWTDHLLSGGEKSALSLTPKAIGERLGSMLDDKNAAKLFAPEALAQMRRLKVAADAAGKRGAAPDAGSRILGMLMQLPGWAKVMGAKTIGGGLGYAAGGPIGAGIGAAAGVGAERLAIAGAKGRAATAMQPPMLVPPSRNPTALAAGLGGAMGPNASQPGLDLASQFPGMEQLQLPSAQAGGLLDQTQPLAVEGSGLLGR